MSNHKKPSEKHEAVFGVLFREDRLHKLKQAAKKEGVSAGAIIRRLVDAYLVEQGKAA